MDYLLSPERGIRYIGLFVDLTLPGTVYFFKNIFWVMDIKICTVAPPASGEEPHKNILLRTLRHVITGGVPPYAQPNIFGFR